MTGKGADQNRMLKQPVSITLAVVLTAGSASSLYAAENAVNDLQTEEALTDPVTAQEETVEILNEGEEADDDRGHLQASHDTIENGYRNRKREKQYGL